MGAKDQGVKGFKDLLRSIKPEKNRSFTREKKFFSENESVGNQIKKILDKCLHEPKDQSTFVLSRRYPEKLR